MALSSDRNTKARPSKDFSFPAGAAKKFYAGALVVLNAAVAEPGSAATTLRAVGRCREQVDNSGGGAGALQVPVERGCFQWANSAAGDAITLADVGNDCYIVDDQTVAKTNGTNTRSVAGKVRDVDAGGVWVEI
jgi:hypothetical protein